MRSLISEDFMARVLSRIELYQFGFERRLGKAALSRRSLELGSPVSDNSYVHFIIPLIAPNMAKSWPGVCANLRNTLLSLLNQSNAQWRASICCQSMPEGLPVDDRVTFVRYRIPGSLLIIDKAAKLRALIRDIFKTEFDGYLYFLDGDDIVHPELVDFILCDNNGHGY